jgi:hypothetical protein
VIHEQVQKIALGQAAEQQNPDNAPFQGLVKKRCPQLAAWTVASPAASPLTVNGHT